MRINSFYHFLVLFFISIITIHSSKVCFQPLTTNYFDYQYQNFLFDIGKNWNELSIFNPIKIQKEDVGQDKSKTKLYLNSGLHFRDNNFNYYAHGQINFKNYYYAYLYPKIMLGRNLYKARLNNNNSATVYNDSHGKEMSGLGFQNKWLTLQIARGNENWGSGNNINLALSNKSNFYDYLILGSDYGRLRVRYIHGFLETIHDGINRYITARGIEWTNKKFLLIGFSEIIIYSGSKRHFDIGYLNPISSHLEVELNNRLNINGDSYSNAVWQLHLDYFIKQKVRLSLNLLFDEFVLDQDIQSGKEHGAAYSLKTSYNIINFNQYIITTFFSIVKVGVPTFRHGMGTNNFVHAGRPLGWQNGSDSQEIVFGINFFNSKNLLGLLSIGLLNSGEETILNRPYDPYKDYQKSKFPSGDNENSIGYNAEIHWKLQPNLFLFFSLNKKQLVSDNINDALILSSLGLDYRLK